MLTDNVADDAGQVLPLLKAAKGEITSATADGAYDGERRWCMDASEQTAMGPARDVRLCGAS